MRVQEAIEDYRYHITRLTEESQRWYMRKLAVFGEWCEKEDIALEKLRPKDVGRFLDSLRPRISPQTKKPITASAIHGYGRVIRAFLGWASKEYEGDVSPRLTKRIALPKVEQKVIEILTPEHIRALFAACDKEFRHELQVRDRAILSVLIDTGIRAGELCTLTLNNVHLSPDDAWIVVMGKGRRQREVGLGMKARIALHKYIRLYRSGAKPEEMVMLSRFHKPLTVHGLDMIIYRLAEWARITDVRVHAHVFRHTASVLYLENGGDVYMLSRRLGHGSIGVTENYLKALKSRQARKQGVSVLDNLEKGR